MTNSNHVKVNDVATYLRVCSSVKLNMEVLKEYVEKHTNIPECAQDYAKKFMKKDEYSTIDWISPTSNITKPTLDSFALYLPSFHKSRNMTSGNAAYDHFRLSSVYYCSDLIEEIKDSTEVAITLDLLYKLLDQLYVKNPIPVRKIQYFQGWNYEYNK